MAWDERDEEERRLLRARLRVLAERSGLTVPPLDVVDDPRGRLLPATVRDGGDGEHHIAVSSSLLRATPVEQVWHLASALGHWASPVPRRRRREGWAATAVLVALGVGFGLLGLTESVDLPRGAALVVSALLGLIGTLGTAAASRRTQRALDEAGGEVLRRSGYDPAALTRQVFGDRPDPPWWTRVHAREPAPSARPRPEAQAPCRVPPRACEGRGAGGPSPRGEEDGVLSHCIRAAVSSSRTSRSAAGRRGQDVHSGSGGSR